MIIDLPSIAASGAWGPVGLLHLIHRLRCQTRAERITGRKMAAVRTVNPKTVQVEHELPTNGEQEKKYRGETTM